MKLITFVRLVAINAVVSGGLLQHDVLNKRQGLAGSIIDLAAKAIGTHNSANLEYYSDLPVKGPAKWPIQQALRREKLRQSRQSSCLE